MRGEERGGLGVVCLYCLGGDAGSVSISLWKGD